ncbi:MAG: ribosome silencing factor [Planctomycetota bacterium]|nr:ribosome silencing factor [Planctomycetota bacterium]
MTAAKKDRDSEALLQRIARAAYDVRAEDLVALDVRGLVQYMDFLLIATGSSARRIRAISERVIKNLKQDKELPISRSGIEGGSWICLDFVDVVFHIFDRETRGHYDLELLWADAPRYELDLPTVAAAVPADDDEEPLEEGVIEPPRRSE